MPPIYIDEPALREALSLNGSKYRAYVAACESEGWTAVVRRKFYCARERSRTRGEMAPGIRPICANVEQETQEQTADTWSMDLRGTPIHTLEELLTHCKVDTSVWDVERFVVNKWEVGAKGNDGLVAVTPLFQVKATLKRNAARAAACEIISGLIEKMQAHAPFYSPVTYLKRQAQSFCLEPALYDVHLGKLAWSEESGHSYDLKIAESRYDDAMDDIIRSAGIYDIDRVCLPLGHDFFHVDTRENKTAHGTVVTADSRQQKVFQVGCSVIVRGIDRLREIAPVDVVMVPGNHDLESNFSLGEVLKAWYRRDDSVNIDNRAAVRKYYEYGKVMLQLTHGSEETPGVRCAALAAAEQPAMWGRTLYRETHQGHRHKKMSKREYIVEQDEYLGYIVRIISALSETDDWHFGKAFVENLQGAESFIWSAERGLVNHHFYTVPDELRRAA